MTQILLKELPSTIVDAEINLSSSLKESDKELLIEVLEYIEDYLYISEREENNNIKYVNEKSVMELISKYK